ncbi:MAG TPA: TylF/MycF/NovP-related O-methyltransferase [Acidimicrobiales bacterium]|nr:TylF/MycF/NovP-related O-methyltransferase [Acidimicrobiales bacterium]
MKSRSADDRYLADRQTFSDRRGPSELWSVVDHWPLYCGIGNLARNLAITDLFRSTLAVPGHVAEFGTWRGSTALLLAKLLRIYDPLGPKVVHCFDSFQGLAAFSGEDGTATDMAGRYKGSEAELREVIALYEMADDVEIHDGLIEEVLPSFLADRAELRFSFVFCDTDLYSSTSAILSELHSRLVPGGVFVFDEWNYETFPGEGIAVNDFLGTHAESYELIAPPATRQPSLALRKRR